MGILDDAIREHLELKRKYGADQTDLEQLEKEAFGPPARPGDEEPSQEQPAPAPRPGEEPEEPSKPEPAPEPPAPSPQPAPAASGETVEVAAADLPDAGETEVEVERGVESPPDEALRQEEPGKSPVAAGEETQFYDVEAEEFEIDLELDEEELRPQGPEVPSADDELEPDDEGDGDEDFEESPDEDFEPEEPEASPAEPVAVEHAVIVEDTDETELPAPIVRHAGEDDDDDEDFDEDFEDEPEDDLDDEDEPAARFTDDVAGGDDEDEDEDVLEDTPDFLEDSGADDDELWFEQGKPKDFDF